MLFEMSCVVTSIEIFRNLIHIIIRNILIDFFYNPF